MATTDAVYVGVIGTVAGCDADPLPAPAMPTVRLKARNRHGRRGPDAP